MKVKRLGLVSYHAAWKLQQDLHRRIVDGTEEATVLLLEHPPVITFGKHGDQRFLHAQAPELTGVELVTSDRGGQVTAHMPGQLIAYVLCPLRGQGPRRFVWCLEEAVIQTLGNFGLEAARDAINPGVWLGEAKVAAIGMRIKERVTMHGLSLNVANDLTLFNAIVPCGLKNRTVTSMSRALGRVITVEAVQGPLERALAQVFAQG